MIKQPFQISALGFCLMMGLSIFSTGAAEPTPATATANTRAPEDKEQLARRLASIATLIETSSAAKQIDTSANAEALALRDNARDLRQQAEAAYKSGDYPRASSLLDQAAKRLFEGVRLASPEQVNGEKEQRDFDNRMESVKALLAAQQRISAEKGTKAASNTAEAQLREAAALAAAGKIDEGRVLLDNVYLTTKQAIEGMREGDTLVRSLHFANKEEEYRYELDRNDTHKMLVKVLLDEKRASNAELERTVQKFLEQAAILRAQAEATATKKDFEGAIKLLEDSTKELVRAIRSAGVYIPG